jgi:primary-amine oxidase
MNRNLCCVLLIGVALAARAVIAAEHPLDPLSREELAEAVAVLRASNRLPEGSLFPILTLQEPSKDEVRAWRPGAPLRRQAFVVVLDRRHSATYEAVVDLTARRLRSWRRMEGVHPAVLVDEFSSPAELVRADPRWQAAMRRRGITDFENVQIDVWAAGRLTREERASGRRLLRCLSFYRGRFSDNAYVRPIEGVVALVDVGRDEVLDVVDRVAVPLNDSPGEMDESAQGRLRELKPLRTTTPLGPDFQVRGHEVRWQKWRLRWSLHPREGLVLHEVGYEDGGRVRPILHRASLSEMVVPYGEADTEGWTWRNAFDVGEYGVGRLATTLQVGGDVPEHALLFDATFADDFGTPYVQPRAVALYERDAGVLWRHYDYFSGRTEARRRRQLVLTYVSAVGNYDYALSWVFDQDGRLSLEADLTGILLLKGVASRRSTDRGAEEDERHGRRVATHVVAPHHQHFFNFRLDFDVDGRTNAVVELNNQALPPGPGNPHLNAFGVREDRLCSERQARRDLDMHQHRKWRVVSTNDTNALGQPTGYLLMPGENAMPYLQPDAEPYRRAGFLAHHLWVTRYRERERYAAGDYPNQGRPGEGLPRWVSDDESVDGQDVVLWYTLGVTHNARPEEYPVMPVHRVGFELVPDGFFTRNPAMDVPGADHAP